MILTSKTATVPYTVPWRKDDPNAPVFHLRAGDVIERGMMEAVLSGEHNAARVNGYELMATVKSGVAALFADDPDIDRLLAIADANAQGESSSLSEDDKALLAEMLKLLAAHWPDYRDMAAQAERRRELAPIEALRFFCVDITGIGVNGQPIEFKRDRAGRVSVETLGQLEGIEMIAAGNRCYVLQLGGGADMEKNSEPPPASGGDRQTSTPRAGLKAGGKSTATPGKKTRARPARPGRLPSSTSTS